MPEICGAKVGEVAVCLCGKWQTCIWFSVIPRRRMWPTGPGLFVHCKAARCSVYTVRKQSVVVLDVWARPPYIVYANRGWLLSRCGLCPQCWTLEITYWPVRVPCCLFLCSRWTFCYSSVGPASRIICPSSISSSSWSIFRPICTRATISRTRWPEYWRLRFFGRWRQVRLWPNVLLILASWLVQCSVEPTLSMRRHLERFNCPVFVFWRLRPALVCCWKWNLLVGVRTNLIYSSRTILFFRLEFSPRTRPSCYHSDLDVACWHINLSFTLMLVVFFIHFIDSVMSGCPGFSGS